MTAPAAISGKEYEIQSRITRNKTMPNMNSEQAFFWKRNTVFRMGRRLQIYYLDRIYAIFPLFINNWKCHKICL